jgi:hypothetical protein
MATIAILASGSFSFSASLAAFAPLANLILPRQTYATSSLFVLTHI